MIQTFKKIKQLKRDKHSGSVEILNKLIRYLNDYLKKGETGPSQEKEKLIGLLESFHGHYNQFKALEHFLDQFILHLGQDGRKAWKNDAAGFIDQYVWKWENVNMGLARNFCRNIEVSGKHILLHSNSSAVRTLFEYMNDRNLRARIIQTESRPGYEGRLQASILSELGFEVFLVIDAAVTRYIPGIDMAIVGSDYIRADYFINKTGTHSIALACREYGVPLYVISDSRKLCPETGETANNEFEEARKPAGEIWDNPPYMVRPENYYFEKIPNKLADKFITEDRIISGQEMKKNIS